MELRQKQILENQKRKEEQILMRQEYLKEQEEKRKLDQSNLPIGTPNVSVRSYSFQARPKCCRLYRLNSYGNSLSL